MTDSELQMAVNRGDSRQSTRSPAFAGRPPGFYNTIESKLVSLKPFV